MRSTIICVDDDKLILSTLADQLAEWVGNNYAVEKATGGSEALEVLSDCNASGTPVSVIISDYIMPGMRGDELLCKIHERDKSIRNIMLTGYSQLDGIKNAINNAGLYRFISKPWDKKDLMLTVIEAIKSYEQEKANQNLLHSFERLYRGYEAQLDHIISAVATAIDMRSGSRPEHSRNVVTVSQKLGTKAGLNADALKDLRTMAAFHDIGRIILFDHDLKQIQENDQTLHDILPLAALQNEGAKKIFSQNPQFDKKLLDGICFYLEKYDGTGLRSLKGIAIPKEARIIAIANNYDLLVSNGASSEAAIVSLGRWNGTVLDPELLRMFRDIM